MGVLIDLEERRRARRRAPVSAPGPARATLFFDLGDPFSYLAAERVDRAFDTVNWLPVFAAALHRRTLALDAAALGALRTHAERRAADLRMPLVWPERFPSDVPGAMRAASLAAESGRGAAFALAACRLAFCGGFDLDDPEILAEAAAAAGLGLDECLHAAGDRGRDAAMEAAARRLLAEGADRLPVLRVGAALFCGEERIAEAAAAARYAAVN